MNFQLSVTANDFNNFLAIPYKTITNVNSSVSATEFLEKFFDTGLYHP